MRVSTDIMACRARTRTRHPLVTVMVMAACIAGAWVQLAAAGCLPQRELPCVRVAIATNADAVHVAAHGNYRVTDPETSAPLLSGRTLPPTAISAGPRGLRLGAQDMGVRAIRLQASKGFTLHMQTGAKRYRGELDILLDNDGRLTAVNRIGIEEYIQGVLYHEVSDRWPKEALQAQAVAARSYALYQVNAKKPAPYDVTGDIYSQVYGGRSAERPRTNRAVRKTRGQALLYQGSILPAFFHASCGGHTEDASQLWKHDLPSLKGVACRYCAGRPGYAWKRNFHSQAVQELLGRHGHVSGAIKDIAVTKRNASGRVAALTITDRSGATVSITGKDFRAMLGPNVVRSSRYDVVMQGYYFDLIGRGWGHGVGMCQQGTCGMALEGRGYLDILAFYYPGAAVARAY